MSQIYVDLKIFIIYHILSSLDPGYLLLLKRINLSLCNPLVPFIEPWRSWIIGRLVLYQLLYV